MVSVAQLSLSSELESSLLELLEESQLLEVSLSSESSLPDEIATAPPPPPTDWATMPADIVP